MYVTVDILCVHQFINAIRMNRSLNISFIAQFALAKIEPKRKEKKQAIHFWKCVFISVFCSERNSRFIDPRHCCHIATQAQQTLAHTSHRSSLILRSVFPFPTFSIQARTRNEDEKKKNGSIRDIRVRT